MLWPFNKQVTIFSATNDEQQEAIERLVSQGTFKSGYYLFLLLATFIVTPGLILNNVAVIIGGMVLAPLMIPILSLSLSIVSRNPWGMLRALRILITSFLAVVVMSALVTYVMQQVDTPLYWIPDTISVDVYVFIAFCSGLAGAFSWVKEHVSPAFPGVAISVSLLPPLSAAGIALALGKYVLLQNSLLLFAANILGILLASFLVFLFLGLGGQADHENEAIEDTKS